MLVDMMDTDVVVLKAVKLVFYMVDAKVCVSVAWKVGRSVFWSAALLVCVSVAWKVGKSAF